MRFLDRLLMPEKAGAPRLCARVAQPAIPSIDPDRTFFPLELLRIESDRKVGSGVSKHRLLRQAPLYGELKIGECDSPVWYESVARGVDVGTPGLWFETGRSGRCRRSGSMVSNEESIFRGWMSTLASGSNRSLGGSDVDTLKASGVDTGRSAVTFPRRGLRPRNR